MIEDLVTLILEIYLVCNLVEVASYLFLYHLFICQHLLCINCNLAGVRQDGHAAYFFHRRFESYSNEGDANISWKKVGTSRSIFLDGTLQGCKEVFVLYADTMSDKGSHQTDWRLHQYHIRNTVKHEEELVLSKIFFESRDSLCELAEEARVEAKLVTTFLSCPFL